MNDQETDELELAIALQDAMLPTGVPVLPMLDVGARFRFADGTVEPVGSWLDVVALPDGRIALVVGEAPGTGIAAAAAMGRVSAVVRAGLRQAADVSATLGLADGFAGSSADTRGTTVTVALVDPVAATLSYATAGHPPPLVVLPSGATDLLAGTGGRALGLGGGAGFETAVRALAPDDLVLLTSAAAVHRGATARLGDTRADLDELASGLHAAMDGEETVTLVAARLRPAPHDPLRSGLARERGAAALARERLGAWLDAVGSSPMDRMALVHATAELVTNAVEHGGPGGGRWIELNAEVGHDGTARVEVHDGGSWRPPSDGIEGGRGLAMAAGLVDELELSTDDTGTHALLRHRLAHPLTIQPGASAPPVHHAVEIRREPHTIALHGAFTQDDVEQVGAEVLIATRAGMVALTLDLCEVTRLDASAVRLLADLSSAYGTTSASGATGHGLRIRTARSSAVHLALDTAGVPHDAA